MHAAFPVELEKLDFLLRVYESKKVLSRYSGCWWGLLRDTWLDRWAPAWTDFMPSAVGEAPLAADRGGGKCSVCNNIHMFMWLVLWLLSHCWRYFGSEGGNLVTLIWRDISLNPSRTDMLLLDTTAALSAYLWPGGCAACDDNFGPNHHFFFFW